jgi:hypothetical protein
MDDLTYPLDDPDRQAKKHLAFAMNYGDLVLGRRVIGRFSERHPSEQVVPGLIDSEWFDTAAKLAAANPILPEGSPGKETDTLRCKRGDGHTPWNELPYCYPGDDHLPPGYGFGVDTFEDFKPVAWFGNGDNEIHWLDEEEHAKHDAGLLPYRFEKMTPEEVAEMEAEDG